MPVEIKELVIRAVVDPSNNTANNPAQVRQDKTEAIVEACVQQVLRILRRSKER